MKQFHLMLLLSASVLVLLAVGIFQLSADSPQSAASEFLRALASADGRRLAERTCAGLKQQPVQASLLRSAFSTTDESLTGENSVTAGSRLTVMVSATLTDTARVRVSGAMASGPGIASTTTRVDEMWRMVKEGGVWKFCGEDLLPQSGLAALLLQPAEVSFPLIDSEDTLADTLGAYPQTYSELRRVGAQGAVLKEYTLEGKWIDSFAFWFPTYGDAAKGSRVFVNFLQSITRTNQRALPEDDLGDDGASFSVVSPPDYELYAYVWRVKNVVLALGIRAKPGKLTLSDARSWADKMQSHVR